MISIAKSVNFGVIKASLGTVGYTLKNSDGSEKQARSTSGITELVTGKGIYGGNIDFDETWSGFIVWDSGDASPYYAIEQFDYRTYTLGGGGVAIVGGGQVSKEVWTEKEKKRVLRALDLLSRVVANSSVEVTESIEKKLNDIVANEIKPIQEKNVDLNEVYKKLNSLKETFSKFNALVEDIHKRDVDFGNLEGEFKALRDEFGQYKLGFDPIFEGIDALLDIEHTKLLLREVE